uniref:Dps family protein n=2 Tax=Veillonellaceae TaxID=31977 RepID=UPI003FF13893
MEKELNKLLADLVVEYHKLQSFHWYLKGYHFFDDHKKFEEYYGDIADAVDGVAENMLKLGLKPESTMKGFMALSTIEEAKNKEVTSEEAYEIILKDFKQLLDEVKAVKALAEKD